MLHIDVISKSFVLPHRSVVRALDGITLTIESEQFAVVVGANGSGKTTLFDIIAGRINPDSGQLYIDRDNITHLAPHKRSRYVTLLSQARGAGLPRAMTVREVMRLVVETIRRRSERQIEFVDDQLLLRRLEYLSPGLSRILDTQLWYVSGGEYQLIALAIAAIKCEYYDASRHILILDEHISQLAPTAQDNVLRATRELVKRQKLTAMMATHNPDVATSLGDRQIVLANGKIVEDFSGKDKISDPTLLRSVLARYN